MGWTSGTTDSPTWRTSDGDTGGTGSAAVRSRWNRGAVVRLRRYQRLLYDGRTWYGVDFREVTLRVWHDGSVSVEGEIDR